MIAADVDVGAAAESTKVDGAGRNIENSTQEVQG
jgi:hypothetical protein